MATEVTGGNAHWLSTEDLLSETQKPTVTMTVSLDYLLYYLLAPNAACWQAIFECVRVPSLQVTNI